MNILNTFLDLLARTEGRDKVTVRKRRHFDSCSMRHSMDLWQKEPRRMSTSRFAAPGRSYDSSGLLSSVQWFAKSVFPSSFGTNIYSPAKSWLSCKILALSCSIFRITVSFSLIWACSVKSVRHCTIHAAWNGICFRTLSLCYGILLISRL